nr:PREDICTED: uncharacterized protein LOC102365587 isoform X3 [Latimeria chalumnae]|eukprot:XP_014346863.1 PREDICTED: uncharacterized protein LOC102365587 isoform X3 [Latimeria chalumnae]
MEIYTAPQYICFLQLDHLNLNSTKSFPRPINNLNFDHPSIKFDEDFLQHMRSNDEGIHRDTSVMEMVMSEESVFTQDHSKRISEVDTASFNAFSQKQTKMDLLLAPKGKTEPLHLSQDEIRSACRKEKLGGILCEETHGVDETNEILPQFKLGNYKCVGEELPVSASVLKHPETEGALNWLEEMTNNTEDKITGSSSTGETMTGNQAESTGKEISEGFLDKSIDYIKCLIQRNKLAKEGIKEKLFEIKSVEIAEDNCSSNEDLHDFEEEIEVHEMSSSCLTDEFFFNSKIKYRQQSNRKLLFTQQNHSLKQQVKTLQDEVCHLKQKNGGISAVSEGTKHTVHLLKVKLDEYYKHKNEQNELIAKMESLLEQKCKLCKRLVPENIRLQRRVNSLRYKVHTINQALQTQMAALPAIFQNHTRTICSSHGCHQETDIHLRSGHQHHTQPAY